MSAQEIIGELPKLSRAELEAVNAQLHALLSGGPRTSGNVWKSMLELAGTADGLPSDFAEQHDHYLHGAPPQ